MHFFAVLSLGLLALGGTSSAAPVKDNSPSLNGVVGKLGGLENSIKGTGNDIDEIIADASSMSSTELADKLQPKIDELAAKIDNTADAITKSTKRRSLEKRATLDEIAQAVAGVVTSVVDILGSISDLTSLPGLGDLLDLLNFGGLDAALNNLLTALGNLLEAVLNLVADLLQGLADALNGLGLNLTLGTLSV